MNTFVTLTAAVAVSAVLSGCSTGSGGGGGGGGGTPDPTPADFDAKFNAATGLGPTLDLPVSGRANYEGQVQVDMAGSALSQANDVRVVGDASLEVDFAAGNASGLDGIAQNFVATLDDGSTSAFTGVLLLTPGTSALNRTDLLAPLSGSSGALSAFYEGQLEFDGTTADVDMSLQGPAFGAGAAAFAGAANVSVDFAPGQGTDVLGAGGQFYLERQ